MQFNSILPVDSTLSGATTPDKSGLRSDGKTGLLRIPQSSSITGVSPSNCLVSYPGHLLGWSYHYAEKRPAYSTVPADWVIRNVKLATVVAGDPKAPFSIATTPFPVKLHFTLDMYFIMLSVKWGCIKYHFLSLWYDSTWDWTPVSRPIDEHSTH